MSYDRTLRITLRLDALGLLDEVWFDLYDNAEVSVDTLLSTWSVVDPYKDLTESQVQALWELHEYGSARVPRLFG